MATFGSVKKALAGKFWIWEVIPEGPDLAEAHSIAVSKAITGEKTPKEALDDAQKDFEKLMKKWGYLKK